MTNIITSSHYNDTVKIDFYPDSHRYKKHGEKTYLIGVTTATGMLDKSRQLLSWASRLSKEFLLQALQGGQQITEALVEEAVKQHTIKKEEGATIGSAVHNWAEQYIAGKNPPVPADEKVRNGVLAFIRWVNENKVEFMENEKTVYSQLHNYVGRMDCVFRMNGRKEIHAGDFKTSNGVYAEMLMQVSAYQEAYTEEFGTEFDDMYILRFDKETGMFESHCYPKEEHNERFAGFLSCLGLKEFSKAYESKYGYYAKQS